MSELASYLPRSREPCDLEAVAGQVTHEGGQAVVESHRTLDQSHVLSQPGRWSLTQEHDLGGREDKSPNQGSPRSPGACAAVMLGGVAGRSRDWSLPSSKAALSWSPRPLR